MLGRVQRDQHLLRGLLAASSLTDRLTGLYNYGTFVDYLHNEVTKADRYGGRLTLIMFDLDHFKRFNDEHGHEAGNDLLRRVGATLQAVVREADMAARYGGEEFTLLIRGDADDGYELGRTRAPGDRDHRGRPARRRVPSTSRRAPAWRPIETARTTRRCSSSRPTRRSTSRSAAAATA